MESKKSQSLSDSRMEVARSFERIALEYYRKGFLEESAAAMEYALKQYPTASLWYNLGSVFDELNRREEAVEAFEIALSIEPSLTPAYNNLGVVWARLGERRKARAAFRQVLKLEGGSPADAFHRSAAYYNLGKTRHAVRAFVGAVHAYPQLAAEFTDLHAALSQERRMESLLAKQGHAQVSDAAASGQSWFKWPLFDTGFVDFARALMRGELRPRRQVYVGAGILTATALSPVLALIPQTDIYKNIVEGGVLGQFAPQPSSVPQVAPVPPPVSSEPQQSQSVSRRWGPVGGVPQSEAPAVPPSPSFAPRASAVAATSPMGEGMSSSSANTGSSSSPVLGDSGATRRSVSDYNIRLGPVGMDVTASGSMTFNDNISSSEFDREQDFITTLGLNMATTWEITRFNSLDFNIGASFSKYLNNSDLDSFNNFATLSPDTNITFNAQAGDVLFTVFERLSYSINPVDAVIPGSSRTEVKKFSRFSNSVGVNAKWAPNKRMMVSAGASRQDTLPQQDKFDFSHTSGYNFPLGISYKLAKNKTVGANFAYTIQNSQGENTIPGSANWQNTPFKNNDVQQMSFSPNLEWSINPRLTLSASLGYSKILSDNNGTNGDTSEDGSVTGSLFLSHTASKRFDHSLGVSRGLDFGFTSNSITTTNFNYDFGWKFLRDTSLNGGLTYQRGKESLGEEFNRYSGSLGMGYQISKKTSMSLNYTHTRKSSDQAGRGYHQNQVNFGVSYDF